MLKKLSALAFAHRAKNIQNKPEVNQKTGKAAFIKEYIEEIDSLKADLMATREKCGFYLTEDNYKEMVNPIESQGIEINQLLCNNKSLVEISEKKEELNHQLSESLEKYMNDLKKRKAALHETKKDRDKQVFLLQHRVETEKNLTSQVQSLLSVAYSATKDVDLHNTLHKKDSGCNACDAYLRHSSSEVNNTLQIQDEVINKMCSLNKELGTQACSHIDSVLKESSEANELNTKEVMNFLNEILIKQQQMSNELADFKRMHISFFQDLRTKLEVQQREEQNFLSYFNRSLEELKTGKTLQINIFHNPY